MSLSASPQQILTAGQGVYRVADELDAALRALIRDTEDFLDGGWTGQAANAFRADFDRWSQAARQVVGALDVSAGLLVHTGQQYQSVEAANTDRNAQAV